MTTTTTTDREVDTRTAYTAGLRALADLLDERPDIPLPNNPGTRPGQSGFDWYLFGDQDRDAQKAAASALVRALPGSFEKVVTDTLFRYTGRLGDFQLQVIVDRNAVCERVVTGTREVTREVAGPEALAAVPTTVVTETVEDVEWVCAPLLAPADEPAAVPA